MRCPVMVEVETDEAMKLSSSDLTLSNESTTEHSTVTHSSYNKH
jgi:hypothetical protein